jgi:hypothetical protein
MRISGVTANMAKEVNFVIGLLNDGVEPYAHVGGQQVHQTELSQFGTPQLGNL